MVTKELTVYNKERDLLKCILNLTLSDKPLILTLHAFTGRKENRTIFSIFKQAEEEGFNSLCFDFSGHGRSTGDLKKCNISKQLTDLDSIIKTLIPNKKIILVGNSFSVTTAIAYAYQYPNIIGLILISGRAKLKANAKKLITDLKTFENKKNATQFVQDYLKYHSNKLIKNIQIPTFILHGEKDEIVPVRDASILLKNCSTKNKELFILKNESHRFSNEGRKTAVKKIFEFIKKID